MRERLAALAPGVELGENLRFDPGEKANDPAFVASLIEGFDAYVNEAFGVAHRRHASIVGPPQFLPSAAGLRLASEVEVLGGMLDRARPAPSSPWSAGPRWPTRSRCSRSWRTKVDTLVVGGGHGLHLPGRAGPHASGAPCSTPTTSRTAGTCSTRVPRSSCPPTSGPSSPAARSAAGGSAPGAGSRSLRATCPTAGPGSTSARVGRRLRRGRQPRRHGAVERAAGRLRGPTVRRRHPGGGPGGGRRARASPSSAAATAPARWRSSACADKVDFLSTGGGASLTFIERGGDLPALEALRHAPNAPR